jgi:hypothetical protein
MQFYLCSSVRICGLSENNFQAARQAMAVTIAVMNVQA